MVAVSFVDKTRSLHLASSIHQKVINKHYDHSRTFDNCGVQIDW